MTHQSSRRPIAVSPEEFLELPVSEQVSLLLRSAPPERQSRMRLLASNDAADVVQAAPEEVRESLLDSLEMSLGKPGSHRPARLFGRRRGRPDGPSVRTASAQAFQSMKRSATCVGRRRTRSRHSNAGMSWMWNKDSLVWSLWCGSFSSPADLTVQKVMNTKPITVAASTDQEVVSQLFRQHNLAALPVVDRDGTMKGVVTLDDIVEVVDEEATEDMQKVGGVSALGTPYLTTSITTMIRKRGGWLMLLFLGEMLTATAMGWYEDQIARAVVLALFVPSSSAAAATPALKRPPSSYAPWRSER